MLKFDLRFNGTQWPHTRALHPTKEPHLTPYLEFKHLSMCSTLIPFVMDAKLGEFFGIEGSKRGEDHPFMLANEEAFPFNNLRYHQDLPIKELETIPRPSIVI